MPSFYFVRRRRFGRTNSRRFFRLVFLGGRRLGANKREGLDETAGLVRNETRTVPLPACPAVGA